MVEFRIRLNMTDSELLNELRGKVSGETRREMMVFMKKHDFSDYPTHKVLAVDPALNYALVARNVMEKDHFGEATLMNAYYLVGINDEGKYFVHPLEGIAKDIPQKMLPKCSIEDIAAWMDRRDQGFTKRVQGDIMMQFVSSDDARGWGTSDIAAARQAMVTIRQTPIEVGDEDAMDELARERRGLNIQNNTFSNMPGGVAIHSGTIVAWGDTNMFHPTPGSDVVMNVVTGMVQMGNHRIITSGRLFMASGSSPQMPFVLATGDKMSIQHSQHGLEVVEIPRQHVALLAPQRGRTISIEQAQRRILGAD